MGRLRSVTDKHSDFLENIIPGSGISIYENAEGGITIELSYEESLRQSYASYFRVVDASNEDEFAIGVTMGEAWANIAGTNCGAVKINGEYVEVVRPSAEVLSGDGTTYVWLHSWIDSSVGAQAEIIFGDDDPPDNPNGGIAFANQLLGRATLNGESLTIVQDYLRGGEHQEILFGNCEGGAIEAIQP